MASAPSKPPAGNPPGSILPDTNLVLLAGRITADPVVTELPSGSVIYSWSVNVACGDGPATSVPVVAFDPQRSARATGAGAEVVVTGQVRRRFFRSAGGTQSRTEVVASRIVAAARARSVSSSVTVARATLDALGGEVSRQP